MSDQNAAPENAPAVDVGATNPSSPPPGIQEAIDRASSAAVNQHLAETPASPRRGRGRPPTHGRYSKSKIVPLDGVGSGTSSALLEEIPTAGNSDPWGPSAPAFDEAASAAMVDVGISALNYLGKLIVKTVGTREIPDPLVVDAAVRNCEITEDAKKNLQAGGMACLRKYSVNIEYGPETMLGVGLIMWGAAIGSQVKVLKDQGSKIRLGNSPQ